MEPETKGVWEEHRFRVDRVVEQVKQRPAGSKISIRKATPAHQLHNCSWKASCHRVDVSALTSILEFKVGRDRHGNQTMLAVCEGQVTMGQLVRDSLTRGFVPQVVPEYTDFTVAGLINGEGIQSSAFRFGVFTHTVVEAEVVLGDGSVMVCSCDVERELFSFLMDSFGTIGIVTRATVALRPCLPFVRTSYQLFDDAAVFVKTFEAAVRGQSGDFLEGVVFSKTCYVMIHSHFCSEEEARSLPLFDPVPYDVERGERYYYQYVQQVVLDHSLTPTRVARPTDVIPTESFLFRSSRGLYWMIESYVKTPALTNQAWFRRICDRKLKETMNRKGFEASGCLTPEELNRCTVQQDMGIMLKRLLEGIEWVETRLGVYPLWICPVAQRCSLKLNNPEFLKIQPESAKCMGDEYLCDIGIYGEPTVHPFYHRRVVKDLQSFVDAPSMWGVSYKTREEIRASWLPIRQKYHADGVFPGVEDKVTFPPEGNPNLDETPIPHWRYVNDYGWYWWITLPALGAAVVTACSALVFGVWRCLAFSPR